MVKHHPTCTADYPEKPVSEDAQAITVIDIGDGEEVHQCVDCGAFVIVQRSKAKHETRNTEHTHD